MIWTRELVIESVARKDAHRPKFDLGRELAREIQARIEAGEPVRVDEIAARLAEEYQGLSVNHPELYPDLYSNCKVMYHPPADELKERGVIRVVDGIEFLLAYRNDEIASLGHLDLVVYVRDNSCPYNGGKFNDNVLVSPVRDFEERNLHLCRKKEDKHCGAIGRSGYFLEIEQ